MYGGAVERLVGEKMRKPLIADDVGASKNRSLPTGFYETQYNAFMYWNFTKMEGFGDIFAVPHKNT